MPNKDITANGAEIVDTFKPTASMEKWVDIQVELKTDNIQDIAEKCNIDRSNWYKWLDKPGFEDWYWAEYEKKIRRYRTYLDSIGLQNAKKDYNYWRDMQKFAGRVDKSEPGVQVNILTAIQQQKQKHDL